MKNDNDDFANANKARMYNLLSEKLDISLQGVDQRKRDMLEYELFRCGSQVVAWMFEELHLQKVRKNFDTHEEYISSISYFLQMLTDRFGDDVCDTVIAETYSSNKDRRIIAIQLLDQFQFEKVKGRLHELLESPDSEQQNAILPCLRKFKDKSASRRVIPMLKSDNAETRDLACDYLVAVGAKEAANQIIELLDDDNERVRGTAAIALGKLGINNITDKLITLLSGDMREHYDLHYAVILALAEIGDMSAIPYIEPYIRKQGEIGGKAKKAVNAIKQRFKG